MVNDKAALEAQRIDALYKRDGPTYRSLCDTLGYARSALENPELYDSASNPQPDQVRVIERRDPTVEDLTDSNLRAISLILERFIPRAPKNNLQGDREIGSRLGRISRLGYPVPDCSGLKGPQIFDIYLGIKDKVFQEKRKRGIK